MDNKFKELYVKDIGNNIEVLKKEFTSKKTGKTTVIQLNYLSWAYAVKVLKEEYPEAGYKHIFYNNKPYLLDNTGCYVGVELWLTKQDRINNLTESYVFPVLDSKMQPILNPNAFQINTAHQRCLAKIIAIVTGLGLNLYTGEDIKALRFEYEKEKEELEEIATQEKAKKEAEIEAYYSKVESYCRNEAPKDYVNAYYTAIHNKYISKSPKLKDDKRFNDLVEKHKPEIKEPSNEFEDALNSSKKIA